MTENTWLVGVQLRITSLCNVCIVCFRLR